MNIFSINNDFSQFTGLKRLGVFLIILIAFFVVQAIGAYGMTTFLNPDNFRDVIPPTHPLGYDTYVNKSTFPLIYIGLFFHIMIGFYFFYLLLKVIFLSKPKKVEILKLFYTIFLTIFYILMLEGSIWDSFFYFTVLEYM